MKNMIFCKIVNLEYVLPTKGDYNLTDYSIIQNKFPKSYYYS